MATLINLDRNAVQTLPLVQRKKFSLALLAGVVLAGTGGNALATPNSKGYGLPNIRVIEAARTSRTHKQLLLIGTTLRTTNAAIARALGVSRQAVYNWINGDQPGAIIQSRIDQLYRAAQLLSMAQVTVRPILAQPFRQGKNFWQLVTSGQNAEELAQAILAEYTANESQRRLLAERITAKRARGSMSIVDPDDLG